MGKRDRGGNLPLCPFPIIISERRQTQKIRKFEAVLHETLPPPAETDGAGETKGRETEEE